MTAECDEFSLRWMTLQKEKKTPVHQLLFAFLELQSQYSKTLLHSFTLKITGVGVGGGWVGLKNL